MKNKRSDIHHDQDQSTKLDRKTIEKNRRNHMKTLCFKLSSLIPWTQFKTSKDTISQQDQLDVAASYIKQLKERIDQLKATKEQYLATSKLKKNILISSDKFDNNISSSEAGAAGSNSNSNNYYLPVVELREMGSGSTIQVVLITGLQTSFMLYQVIAILEEEGAHVLNATSSTLGDNIFHTLHAQVKISRVGVETARVSQRLHDLVY